MSYFSDEDRDEMNDGYLTDHDIEQDNKYIKEIIKSLKAAKCLVLKQYERDITTHKNKPIFWRSEDEGREISERSDLLSEIDYELNLRIIDCEKLIKPE